ncbi:alkylation response protein AidB-like acyl-CoA dehydrogenase [Saccharothrix saharensis]|uniref:Alkylation response protein AidB-like acyl-CoA dehydrogenase n=1 Tax=Saccharothrix saharensis TaxID=571190 RepID=A0A543J980_9PSEU|nr:acyl-CoA dehydrogenase family protein [Saccharothrix saharensis]TQM79382.1 alkylation response protein AidB-like acyl-CoA dehydrogenase [Saccharothrix saharensis]
MPSDVLDRIRDYVRDELLDHQDQLDSIAEMPLARQVRLHQLGLANWWLPKDAGGSGLTLEDSVDVVSELSYGDAGTAFTQFISILGTTMVSLYGSQALQDRYLSAMAATGGFCATLGSEKEAGSNLAEITTTVRRAGGHLVLDGLKYFSTNTAFAQFLVVIARSADVPDEHLAVVVPADTPGIRILKRWEMQGLRSSGTYEVALDNCRVPADHALVGPGLRLLEVALNASRILIATTAVGVSRRIRDLCMDYAEEKSLYGGVLADHPVFAGKLGQIEMRIEVMLNQCKAAAREFDALVEGPAAAETLVRRGTLRSALAAKMYCGQAGWENATVGSEVFGGFGYTRESLIGKLVRDIRYVSIVEGGDDVLRELLYNRYVVPVPKRL